MSGNGVCNLTPFQIHRFCEKPVGKNGNITAIEHFTFAKNRWAETLGNTEKLVSAFAKK